MRYEHTINGRYNETLAILDDGRRIIVNTQYGICLPLGQHAETCAQVTKMGGVCDCGMLAGINITSLVADARDNGKMGPALVEDAPAGNPVPPEWTSQRGLTLSEEMDREDTIY